MVIFLEEGLDQLGEEGLRSADGELDPEALAQE